MSFRDAVLDGGRLSRDVVALEVWQVTTDGSKLECPEGGWWINPDFVRTTPSEALFRLLLDPHPAPVSHGADLAGLAWQECRKVSDDTYDRLPSSQQLGEILIGDPAQDGDDPHPHHHQDETTSISPEAEKRRLAIESLVVSSHLCRSSDRARTLWANQKLTWMSTAEISKYLEKKNSVSSRISVRRTDRSDQPELRCSLLHRAEMRYVAALPFNFRGCKGLVMYYSHKQRRKRDDCYLLRNADLIGMACALQNPDRELLEHKIQMANDKSKFLKRMVFPTQQSLGTMLTGKVVKALSTGNSSTVKI